MINIKKYKYCYRLIYLLLVSLLVGCSVSTRIQYEDNDGYLPRSFFKSIKKHRTHKDVVINTLGEPVERLRTSSGDEIYTYAFTKSIYKYKKMFFVIRSNSVKRDERYFHVVFNNMKVKKHWWDKMVHVNTKDTIVSRWPNNEAGTDYSLRIIKNAEPDKTNFVLTRKASAQPPEPDLTESRVVAPEVVAPEIVAPVDSVDDK